MGAKHPRAFASLHLTTTSAWRLRVIWKVTVHDYGNPPATLCPMSSWLASTITLPRPTSSQFPLPYGSRPSLFRQYNHVSTQDYRDGRKDNSRCKLCDLFYFWCGLL